VAHVTGFFIQDAWSVGSRLTLNIGMRWDNYKGILPEQSNANVAFDLFDPGALENDGTGPFISPVSLAKTEVLNQSRAVWRTGLVFDASGDGRMAFKANYSRYAQQVGINRVQDVNPLGPGSRTCPWSDPNGDGRFQESEIVVSQCTAFSGGVGTVYADGIAWPYSDEVTAGVERQVGNDMRVGAMFYYRTNRDQIGERNLAVPTSAYTPFTAMSTDGPNGPQPITVYNLPASLASAQDNVRDNDSILDTDYKGVEFTASKRFSRNWQMVAGLTIGQNEGGLASGDLNDPNNLLFDRGIIGNDSKYAFRLSGSYRLPYEIALAGSLVANQGYPFVSTYNITRAEAARLGVTLTRSSQTVNLSRRGDERLPNVVMGDIRISRTFRFGNRRIVPQLDIFNISNVDTVTSVATAVGGSYLDPREIISPRIIRVGFSLDF
jgi:hypothetical protein